MSKLKTVCVLLSTYNGEKYLREQLESLYKQEGVEVLLFVRDDGSSDGTVSILQEYEKKGLLRLVLGQNIGFAKSFSWLIKNAPEADYYACCDQDDVWLPKKLINGVECLESKDNSKPQLYFTSLIVVDKDLNVITTNTVTNYIENAKNRLAENIMLNMVSGLTTIFNHKLKDCFSMIAPDLITFHDYTLNILASAMGEVHFSRDSQILYRQHGNNECGYNRTNLKSIMKAIRNFFRYDCKSIRYKEILNLKYYFYNDLGEEEKKFVDMAFLYKFYHKERKKLKKYLKNNVIYNSSRNFNKFLITFKKF